jgi:hypothetical protein
VVDGDVIWRTDDVKGKITLIATAAGLKAVGIETSEENPPTETPSKSRKPRVTKSAVKAQTRGAKRTSSKEPAVIASAPKPNTKLAMLIAALRAKKGATIEDLTEATGWQAHSVRGAISGALKKKQGLNIVSTPVEGRGRVYRIAE